MISTLKHGLEKVRSSFYLNFLHLPYNYRKFSLTPCFLHRVDAKAPGKTKQVITLRLYLLVLESESRFTEKKILVRMSTENKGLDVVALSKYFGLWHFLHEQNRGRWKMFRTRANAAN
jgi:hypothetical protein